MHLDIETVKRFDRETSMWNAPQRFFFSFFFIYRSAVFSLFIVVVVLMDRFRFHLLQLISKTNTNSCRTSNFLRILKSNNSNMVECKKKKKKSKTHIHLLKTLQITVYVLRLLTDNLVSISIECIVCIMVFLTINKKK